VRGTLNYELRRLTEDQYTVPKAHISKGGSILFRFSGGSSSISGELYAAVNPTTPGSSSMLAVICFHGKGTAKEH
jgi:hypothetical protein